MSLPIQTTVEDLKGLVEYLKNKPTGATISEARAAVRKEILDPRKITAYVLWQVVTKDGERLKLSPRGWELVRKTKPEPQVFKEILDGCTPYRSVLEWAYHQNLEAVTTNDVAAHWHEHHSEQVGTDNENTIKDQAVCFFRLCGAAGLGELTIGRHGQTTRTALNRAELKAYIEAGPSAPPWVEPPKADEPQPEPAAAPKESKKTEIPDAATLVVTPPSPSVPTPKDMRVFISHGKNTQLVEQVETMLGLADVKSEVAVKEETAAIPVPDKVFSAMKRCTAAIIIVSVEETRKDSAGNYTVNENVLIEIGAAFVLYDRRVVLLWDKRLKVPSNLQGLYRCEFEGEDLNWGAGMKLMKAIKGFKE